MYKYIYMYIPNSTQFSSSFKRRLGICLTSKWLSRCRIHLFHGFSKMNYPTTFYFDKKM